ncbi:MAG: hypothetical protein VW416_04520, partial [Gammaproteobacteria bacterium]
VCVPTPMSEDGSQNSEIIENVCRELALKCPESIVVIKSTVLPTVLKRLIKVNDRLIYNPEFLREKHASEDFKNSKVIIFGGDRNLSQRVADFYSNHSNCISKEYIYLDLLSASLVKYSINTFLAQKVTFFNEIYEIYEKLEVEDSWEAIIKSISSDERIGESHMNVPGHDGKKGFGGACFPKDCAALIKFAFEEGIDTKVLRAVVEKNNEIRSNYHELDEREKAQNVSFKNNF